MGDVLVFLEPRWKGARRLVVRQRGRRRCGVVHGEASTFAVWRAHTPRSRLVSAPRRCTETEKPPCKLYGRAARSHRRDRSRRWSRADSAVEKPDAGRDAVKKGTQEDCRIKAEQQNAGTPGARQLFEEE